ncbi:hypothetical protein [Granulicella tundricola]|uniref:hypothetical protein n=1 Tax=Granulicella tundricola TaxID=940615 RepID=UPI0012F90C23|nr:hypothetical protein [Granulicella tundricola]
MKKTEAKILATGSPGNLPHPDYCKPRCYNGKKLRGKKKCECKRCKGKAHGLGYKNALAQGFLPHSMVGWHKIPPDQGSLFDQKIGTDEKLERTPVSA